MADALPIQMMLLSASVSPAGSLVLITNTAGVSASATNFPVGSSVITLLVQLRSTALPGMTITDVASVTTTSTDTNTANNTSSATTEIVGVDLGIVKTGPATVATGTTMNYVLSVSTRGRASPPT